MKIRLFLLLTVFAGSAMAQSPELLESSRPAAAHQILAQLAGTWNFQDAKLAFVKGFLTRTPQYDNRFFKVEMVGGKLPLPVAGGMKTDNYKSEQLEGYDNVRKIYVTTSVNNHIGSDIQFQTGSYDPKTKQLVYEWEDELLPGQKVRNRRILTFVDINHYTEVFEEFKNGAFTKVRELDYSR